MRDENLVYYVGLKVTPETRHELEKIARMRRQTLSEVVRAAIDQFTKMPSLDHVGPLERVNTKPADQRERAIAPAAREREIRNG